jgi:hypothetical protein
MAGFNPAMEGGSNLRVRSSSKAIARKKKRKFRGGVLVMCCTPHPKSCADARDFDLSLKGRGVSLPRGDDNLLSGGSGFVLSRANLIGTQDFHKG